MSQHRAQEAWNITGKINRERIFVEFAYELKVAKENQGHSTILDALKMAEQFNNWWSQLFLLKRWAK